jgi:hypothetical protein
MSDFVDKRGGAYVPVTPAGKPQPPQVRDKETPHQKAQWGADVRPEPLPARDEGYPLPEACASHVWVRSTKIPGGGPNVLDSRDPS